MPENIKSLRGLLSVGLALLLSVWRLLALLALIVGIAVLCFIIADGKSPSEALYLAGITFLTVGYGDVAPTSAMARAASVLLGFAGIVFMGVIVAATIKAIENS